MADLNISSLPQISQAGMLSDLTQVLPEVASYCTPANMVHVQSSLEIKGSNNNVFQSCP